MAKLTRRQKLLQEEIDAAVDILLGLLAQADAARIDTRLTDRIVIGLPCGQLVQSIRKRGDRSAAFVRTRLSKYFTTRDGRQNTGKATL